MTDHDTLPWQPIGPGFSLKLLRGGADEDTRVLLLRVDPGTVIPLHRHAGEVHAYNLAGSRRLLETGELVRPGGYVHEPPGNVDSWMAVGDEPVIVLATVRGAMETLGEDGAVTATSTTRSVTDAYRRFLDGGAVDAFVGATARRGDGALAGAAQPAPTMTRRDFDAGGLRLSYLDSGGDGPVLVALHAAFMEGVTFAPLASALPGWRVLALDQRGHGHSDRAPGRYGREDYLCDLERFLAHVGAGPVALLGHSLGGVNAYQLAARCPGTVRGLIVEDIGAEVDGDLSFVRAWAGEFETLDAFAERVGPRFLPYLRDSLRRSARGWRLAFDVEDVVATGRALDGAHWDDWRGSDCPALVIRGRASRVTTRAGVDQMVARRPRTRLVELEAGHAVHVDDPSGFAAAVSSFLDALPAS